MAEVRKRIVEDTYNTSNIKVKAKKTKKEETKKVEKKIEKETEKKNLLVKFRIFCHGVKSEFEKIHWPSNKDMIKYSIATIVFVIFFAAFFYLIGVLVGIITKLVG